MTAGYELHHFKKGSYITVDGLDELDRFYIIKTGSVERCMSKFLITNNEVRKCRILEAGDLFGVISCMAKRQRMESVLALEDTSVIIVKRDEFEELIKNNTDIAMKIIKYFSKQLRHYDSIIATLNTKSPPEILLPQNINHLYDAGEYYFKNKNYSLAGYAFSRYLQYSTANEKASNARKMLNLINMTERLMIPFEPEMDDHFYYYKKNQPVFMEGEIGEELYVVQSGNVRITKVYKDREVLLNVLPLGDVFGEMSIIENKTRNSNAIAAGDVKLMPVTRFNFETLVQNNPSIVTRIFEILADRLWLVYLQIANLFITDPELKIYDALHTQLMKYRVPIEKNTPCTFDFTVEDILNFTGLSKNEGEALLKELIKGNPNLYINEEGKLTCYDTSKIVHRINFIRRDIEIEKNISASDYSRILDKEIK